MPFLVAATQSCVAQPILELKRRYTSSTKLQDSQENGSRGSPQLLTVHLGQAYIYSAGRPT